MREIKFRVWDEQLKKFHFWGFIGSAFVGLTNNNYNPKSIDEQQEQSWQFTGLKDKNGKEIYEGDIIKFQMTRAKLVDHPVMTAFEDETAIYQGGVKWGEYGWQPFIDGEAKEVEVIGNIYENPELINL